MALLKSVSELGAGHEHHDHAGHEHGHDHGHSHAAFNLTLAMTGAVLIVCSYIAEFVVYPNEPIVRDIAAGIGALILAAPIWIVAVKDIMRFRVQWNELVALALLAMFVMNNYQEAGIIAFFMLLAILVEEKTAVGARESIESLIRLTPRNARRIGADGSEEEVKALDLQVGETVRVRPGENFPVDGTIVSGSSSVNQAPITGESLPVDKMEGYEVYAGTENLTGAVDIRVTKVGSDTTLGKVRDLIVAAEQTRLPIMRLVDRYSHYYTPTILFIAGIVFYFNRDMVPVVMILVIACPCAVVLATPSAVVAAIASAARLGILIKNVSHIEIAANIQAIVFDKTGTLTEGNLEVARLKPARDVELTDLLTVACSAEARSNHPAARAMRRLAEEANVSWGDQPEDFKEIVGRGVEGHFSDGVYRVGRESWLRELGLELDVFDADEERTPEEEQQRMSVIYVSRDDRVLGWIGLQDAIRDGAAPAVEQLRGIGVRQCCMVTGDNQSVAQAVARRVGIDEIAAECLPEGKVDYVKNLKGRGNSVAVVGDGVNDAPALAAGDIGIAMGAIGSDVAVNSASIALMNNDLRRIPFLLELSRKTRAIMHQNLIFGALVIIGGIMLFIFGNQGLDAFAQTIGLGDGEETALKAVIASILHVLSTFIVIFNSARLVRFGEDLAEDEDRSRVRAPAAAPPSDLQAAAT